MKPKRAVERGQALILIALAAIGLVAITGLAIDGSAKFSDRRHAQNAADAAALAGALSKSDDLTKGLPDEACPPPSGTPFSQMCLHLLDAASARATQNGYDDSLASNNVEIYSPPISGHYSGKSAYVQVIITSHVNTWFSRVIGIKETKNTVQAVALAGKGGTLGDGAMIISYDDHPVCGSGVGSGGGSMDISGSANVTLNGGGIFLNSQEHCGYATNCPDLTINGGGINTAGSSSDDNIDQDGCSNAVAENHDQDPIVIPDDINWPNVPPECSMTPAAPTFLGNDEWLIYPGYYETFPHGALVKNKQHIYMASGVYCIDPGGPTKDWDLSWSSVDAASLNGSTDPAKNKWAAFNPDGITLYIKGGGGFHFNNKSPTNLDASTKGDYQGYLMIVEGTQTSIETCIVDGGADIDINGMIFAPYCNITVNGESTSSSTINAQLIGWDIKINGGAGINFTYDPKYKITIKRRVGLMQ